MATLETRPPFEWKNLLIIFACFAGSVYGLFRLYLDFQLGANTKGLSPIGIMERREAEVRRKLAQEFQWLNIEPQDTLFLKDSIQTGPKSSATLKLENGNMIEIGENSLFVFENNQDLSLGFLKGSVVIRDQEGDKQITVQEDGKKSIVALPYRLLNPAALETFYVTKGGTQDVNFEWDLSKEARLQQEHPTPKFLEINNIKKIELLDSNKTLRQSFSEGNYSWTLKSQDNIALTQTRHFKVVGVLPLLPLLPSPSQKIEIFGSKASLRFQWQVPELRKTEQTINSGQHSLEFSSDPSFQNIDRKLSISAFSGTVLAKDMTPGRWHWRLKSEYGSLILYSKTNSFEVSTKASLQLKMNYPKQKSAVELKPRQAFQWSLEGNPQAEYTFHLQTSPENLEILKQKTSTTLFVWDKPRAGSFRYQVTAWIEGQQAAQSEWLEFQIFEGKPLELVSPETSKRFEFWQKPKSFLMEWRGDLNEAESQHFVLQVAKDTAFQEILKEERLSEGEYQLETKELPTGLYYWRVQIVDATEQVTRSSPVSQFYFDYYPLLQAPEIISPNRFNLRTEKDNIHVEWQKLRDAIEYEVEIEPKVFEPKRTRDTKLDLRDLREGTYKIRVYAIDPIERKGAPKAFELLLEMPKLEAPRIKTKEVQ